MNNNVEIDNIKQIKFDGCGMEERDGLIGYLKYKGGKVHDGFLDARVSAQAILGFDEAVRHFIFKQSPNLKKEDFEFPVRIGKGSWEIGVFDIFKIAGGAYLLKAANKLAENDFENIGFKDVLKTALSGIQWVIRIGKHLGDLAVKEFLEVSYRDNNELIGIKNEYGETLFVPKQYLDWYVSTRPNLLSKISEIVSEDVELTIGVIENSELIEVSINKSSRMIFVEEDDENVLLFPELEHDQEVSLVGEVTRGNEITNTIGLDYRGHILNCSPSKGSIVFYKDRLFLKCRMIGKVCRIDEKGFINAKKPKIIFHCLEPLESENLELPIF